MSVLFESLYLKSVYLTHFLLYNIKDSAPRMCIFICSFIKKCFVLHTIQQFKMYKPTVLVHSHNCTTIITDNFIFKLLPKETCAPISVTPVSAGLPCQASPYLLSGSMDLLTPESRRKHSYNIWTFLPFIRWLQLFPLCAMMNAAIAYMDMF